MLPFCNVLFRNVAGEMARCKEKDVFIQCTGAETCRPPVRLARALK